MIIAGIDPGLDGAIAVIGDAGEVTVDDMPVLTLARGGKTKREIDVHALASILSQHIDHAVVEQVNSMPKQGVSSVFAFGKSYGIVIGVLGALRVPMTLVVPRVWKSAMRAPSVKDGARARASQLLPKSTHLWMRKRDDGRAEACLLALFGLRSGLGGFERGQVEERDHGRGQVSVT
jgi:crossover junction endodeoxyribonuclease RuvC